MVLDKSKLKHTLWVYMVNTIGTLTTSVGIPTRDLNVFNLVMQVDQTAD